MKTISAAVGFGLLLSSGAALAQQASMEGRLDPGDPVVNGHSYFDEHRITVAAGQRMAITVTSSDFDPVVEIYRAGRVTPIGQNDDDGSSLNSRYVLTAPAAGDYVVRVMSFGEHGRGAYTVGLAPLAPLPAPVTAHSDTETATWRVFRGEIAAGDPEANGRRFDDYQLTLRQGQIALIRADSEAIDPLIEIMAASERDGPAMVTDDDSGPGLGSLLVFEAPLDGDYVVRVFSLNPETTGAYILRVAE